MKSKAIQITLGGIMGALAVIVMVVGSMLGIATYIAPTLAGILIYPVSIEFGKKTGWLTFAVVSVLALILAPDKELAFAFVFIFGYYPIVKDSYEKLHSRLLALALKLLTFNVAVVAMYFFILNIIAMEAVVQDFQDKSGGYMLWLLLLGNVTFLILDYLLSFCRLFYLKKIRPKIPALK